MVKAVLFDVDGTLVDSNDAHAHAWVRAFSEHGINVPFDAVRPLIGMGGDKLMPRVSHLTEESPAGHRVAERRGEIFTHEFLPTLKPFPGTRELVGALNERGLTVVAASSAKRDELIPLLRIAGADVLMDAATSSDDADASKPAPDIVEAALARAGVASHDAVMVGDTPYDIAAARRAGVRVIAFRCGGWGDSDLDGAIAIYDGPWHLLDHLQGSPLFSNAHDPASIAVHPVATLIATESEQSR
jgi:HAD superfamily hydrolase (TIGR01509 family)